VGPRTGLEAWRKRKVSLHCMLKSNVIIKLYADQIVADLRNGERGRQSVSKTKDVEKNLYQCDFFCNNRIFLGICHEVGFYILRWASLAATG